MTGAQLVNNLSEGCEKFVASQVQIFGNTGKRWSQDIQNKVPGMLQKPLDSQRNQSHTTETSATTPVPATTPLPAPDINTVLSDTAVWKAADGTRVNDSTPLQEFYSSHHPHVWNHSMRCGLETHGSRVEELHWAKEISKTHPLIKGSSLTARCPPGYCTVIVDDNSPWFYQFLRAYVRLTTPNQVDLPEWGKQAFSYHQFVRTFHNYRMDDQLWIPDGWRCNTFLRNVSRTTCYAVRHACMRP